MSETTWRLVPDREADRIRIGDRVRVASTHRFYKDWKDVDLEVVGIARTRLGDLNLTLSEDWPRDGGFDGWRESDLVVVSALKPPAGLYEVRDDGTARRVEINDETVERVGKPIAYALCKAFGIDPETPAKPRGEWPNWLEAMGNGGAEAARAALRALTGEER